MNDRFRLISVTQHRGPERRSRPIADIGGLSDRFQLVRNDETRHGHERSRGADTRLDTLVSDLAAVTQRVAPGSVALLSMSQGAPAAIEYAARYPDRVSCLVLLGGYPNGWRAHGYV